MSVLADKIEQFILHKLLEEDNSDIVLRRNELADELQCAPSQISYVLSTRCSNDNGYLGESRRGSGGFVRIIQLTPKKQD
ncbi:CtsR family transcriptional regulator, partial [Megasphaera sp.]|uniref:CtsR family transcriptional regulator n=1 Tax=Megasphaera sp. TaxID=2023260 RepID=UPI004025D9AA